MHVWDHKKISECHHVSILIRHMLFQAVRNERFGLVVGSLIPNTKVPSSTPSLKLQKKTQMVVRHITKFLGVHPKINPRHE
jgi:hypothetical protein